MSAGSPCHETASYPACSGTRAVAPAISGGAKSRLSCERGGLRTRVISRSMLTGGKCHGPAIVQEYDTTVVVPPGWTAALDDHVNILLKRRDS